MKRIKKSKLIISIILLSLLIIEVITIGLSRAGKTIDITITAIDSQSALANKEEKIEANKNEDGTYSLTFPETVNGFNVKSYSLTREYSDYETDQEAVNQDLEAANISINDIDTEVDIVKLMVGDEENDDEEANENESSAESTNESQNDVVEEKSEAQLTYENILVSHTTEITSTQSEIHTPGSTIVLTKAEQKTKKISSQVTYDTSSRNGTTYYKQTLKANTVYNNKATTVEVEAYVPLNSKLVLKKYTSDQKDNISYSLLTNQPEDKYSFYDVYEPSILYSTDTNELDMTAVNDSNLQEFNSSSLGQEITIKLSNLNNAGYYRLYAVNETTDDYSFAELGHVEGQSVISYTSTGLDKYALLYDATYNLEAVQTATQLEENVLKAASNDSASSKWDGTISTGFITLDNNNPGSLNNPYLITSGSDLAYLAQQVNSGTGYGNSYFKLLVNIDLDEREWTPIGNGQNSFLGRFDGQGHTIRNGKITDDTLPNNGGYIFLGLFGSVGGSNNNTHPYTYIKNLEIKDFNITESAQGNLQANNGYYIGTLAGVVYRNTQIINCVISNSTISVGGGNDGLLLRSPMARIYVGGAIGAVRPVYDNGNNNRNDSGDDLRATITAVFADVDIAANNVTVYRTNGNSRFYHYYAQNFAIGGVIGAALYERTCPTYCSYTGRITSDEGFAGPIMGGAYSNDYANTEHASVTYFNYIFRLSNLRNNANIAFNNYYYGYSVVCNNGNSRNFTTSKTTIDTNDVTNNTNYRYSTTNFNGNYSNASYWGRFLGMNAGQYYASNDNIYTILSNNIFNPGGNPSTDYSEWEDYGDTFNLYASFEVTITTNTAYQDGYDANPEPYSLQLSYTYYWYIDGARQNIAITNKTITGVSHSWTEEKHLTVICIDPFGAIAADTKLIEQYELHIEFDPVTNGVLTGRIAGTGTSSPEYQSAEYTYQWYNVDLADGIDYANPIEGATTRSISDVVEGNEYALVATNTVPGVSYMNAMGTKVIGNRDVVYVNYASGNNNNDGRSPQTPVRTMAKAYSIINPNWTRKQNIIVVMGDYAGNDNGNSVDALTNTFNTQNSGFFNKQATLTGKYQGNSWGTPRLRIYGNKYLSNSTTFMYLELYGNGNVDYDRAIYTEGYSVTMGKGLTMTAFGNYGTGQGCMTTENGGIGGFQLCGPYTPANNLLNNRPESCEIEVYSGTYSRLLASGRQIATATENRKTHQYALGSSSRPYNCTVTIDIQDGVGNGNYDINLLVAGKNCGSVYGNIEINLINGKIGRFIGGNLGRDMTNATNDLDPRNSFFGSTTINMTGGSTEELFAAGYGRNGSYDVFYYGDIELNLTGGRVFHNTFQQNSNTPANRHNLSGNVYGGGAGGVTGFNANNGDAFNTLGSAFPTSISIYIGGDVVIDGDVFGAGYGYSPLLSSYADILGRTYCNTSIVIDGGTINGNVYGAGQGYNYNANNRLNVAQMTGNTSIEISGGTIGGNIYGAGLGIQNKPTIAKLFGGTDVKINFGESTFTHEIYGGSNFADIDGTTKVDLVSGTLSNNVYGGCNRANVSVSATVNLEGATSTGLIFGGSNNEGTVEKTFVNLNSGKAVKVYGGNNVGTLAKETKVTMDGAEITTATGAIYGGGYQAPSNKTEVIIKSNVGTIPYVFGGGENANVTAAAGIDGSGQTNVTVSGTQAGTNITDLFGGSNASGNINKANITINGGTITNIYGANNQGGVTTETNINVTAGKITNTFGGGNKAVSHKTYIETTGGEITNVYGGGNEAGITTANGVTDSGNTYVNIKSGNVTNVFGGSNASGDVENTYVTIGQAGNTGTGLTVENVYGGNNQGGKSKATHVNTHPGTITNVYGGSKGAGASANTTQVVIEGSHITGNLFGGGEEAETSTSTNITVSTNSIVDLNVYGGGNKATVGSSSTPGSTHLSITNSVIKGNAFAAGNGEEAITYGTPYVEILTGAQIGEAYDETLTSGCVFGGGNQAAVIGSPQVLFNGGTINTHVFGGGNNGQVTGSTKVDAKNGAITGSIYGGGNAENAIVTGNTLVNIYGTMAVGSSSSQPPLQGSVFGGGNQAETGDEDNGGSKNIVNIAGGNIWGNVYGGANTSKVWGSTVVNIGLKAIQDYRTANPTAYDIPADMIAAALTIHGTVFGGGEANASGSDHYDWSYISATEGIDVNIDGQGYESLGITFQKSVFGSGNASSSSGTSTIDIYNLGTLTNPNRCVSIQRTDFLTIKNSALSLAGITDSTNYYANVPYTLNYIGDLKLANASTLYLEQTSNCLTKWESGEFDGNGDFQYATINIASDGSGNPSVRNRVYLREGIQLQVIPPPEVEEGFGKVLGMTFLGIYTPSATPYNTTGSYYQDTAHNGDSVYYQAYTFTSVIGKHLKDTNGDPEQFLVQSTGEHDITKAGFYSNKFTISGVTDEELEDMISRNLIDGNTQGTLRTYYVGVTPPGQPYYIWSVGNVDMTTYTLNIEASKYDTLGTKELSLNGFATANTYYEYNSCRFALEEDVVFENKSAIPKIANPADNADYHFGLAMRTGAYGWVNAGSIEFQGEDNAGSMIPGGVTSFKTENAASGSDGVTPDLEFYLYHSQNIQNDGDLGNIKIYLDVTVPRATGGFDYKKICVDIYLTRKVFDDEYVEQSIQPGKKYDIFTSTRTQIVSDGVFSTYDTIYIDDVSHKERASQYMNSKRVLVSTDLDGEPYLLNEGTKITMLDLVSNQTYYYIVTAADADPNNGTYKYYFSNFKKMGSMDEPYNESDNFTNYYYNSTTDELYERYIFHYDFAEAGIEQNVTNKLITLQLETEINNEDITIIELIANQRQEVLYSLFTDSDATIDVEGSVSVDPLYLGKSNEVLRVETLLTQTVAPDGKRIYDTNFFDEQMGVKISLIDALGTQQDSDAMLGVYFTVEGDYDSSGHLNKYYPRIDGSTRIKIGTKVANSVSNITMHTEENQSLVTGSYTIKIETYGSVDGYYYGDETSSVCTVPLTIISGIFGLKITSPDAQKIFKNETGLNTSGDNKLDLTVEYSSLLDNPVVTVSLQRRSYTDVYTKTYEAVDLNEVVANGPTEQFNSETFSSDYMYKVADKTEIGADYTKVYHYNMKTKVPTGTYKVVYSIYDGNTFIGSAYEYFIVN